MRNLFFTFVISIITSNLLLSQNTYFVGHIVYKNAFFTPKGEDITREFSAIIGKEQDYYIKSNNYKFVFNSPTMSMQLYNGLTNKCYIIFPDKTGQEIDASVVSDSALSIEHLSEDTLLLGRKCKKLVMKSSQSTAIYYYDPTLRIDKDLYVKHEFASWNRYLAETGGALAIKYIVKNSLFTWDSEAVKIEEMDLMDSDFELSSEVQLIK